jgi:hypothetical protein
VLITAHRSYYAFDLFEPVLRKALGEYLLIDYKPIMNPKPSLFRMDFG